jgi:pyridoxamine 5'-phosphate oxidase
MALAPWRSPLTRALHRNRSLAYARYAQLATVQPNGRPANRTIVFRGFLDDQTNQLKFVTDSRSEKVDQIRSQPWGELCWYFPNTREQFRLLGQLTLVSADYPDPGLNQARQLQWQELSEGGRSQFLWANPGQPRQAADWAELPTPDPLNPPPNFCLLLLKPMQVDHLELRGEPQNRYRYLQTEDAEADWMVQEINP